MPRMPFAPPFLRYLPFSCRRLTAFFVVSIAPIETSRARRPPLDGLAVFGPFCLRQTAFHTADGRRRLFHQNLEARAEDNYPTTPTAPTAPFRRV